MASDEADAIKDVAGKIDDLGDVGREIDNLKRAVESLTSEIKDLKRFTVLKDVIGDTNDNLAKLVDEVRKLRDE